MDERSMKIYEIFILTKGESTSEAFCYNRGENTVGIIESIMQES